MPVNSGNALVAMAHELSTLFTGRKQIMLDEVDSTNTKMFSIIQHGVLPEGTVVRADFQSGGKGQGQNTWHSEHGKNLLASFLFRPDFIATEEIFVWNKAVALAIYDAIQLFAGNSERVKIKWPNDIYVDDYKLGGLLIENSIAGTTLRQSVVGIGINVNQTEFPDEIPNPISLIQVLGVAVEVSSVLNEIANALERRYLQCKRKDYTALKSEYQQHLYRLNKKSLLEADGRNFTGTITGVNENGQLQVQLEDGNVRAFELKQIRFLNTISE